MRQFKFRSWDNKGKVMIDWLTLSQTAFNRNDRSLSLMYAVIINDTRQFETMEWIGLKDKHKTHVYDGDILSDCSSPMAEHCCWFEVFWHDGDAASGGVGYKLRFVTHHAICGGVTPVVLPKNLSKMKVIGNIYENPELLQQ